MDNYRIVFADAIRNVASHLSHYGVLGMKWGVRRTPEQLGHHRIRVGTKVYAMSDKKQNDSGTGAKRIAYLKPDRDHFRGQGQRYETKYLVTDELNIPSRAELYGVISDVVNGIARKEVAKELSKKLVSETSPGPNPLNVIKALKYSKDLKHMTMTELTDITTQNIMDAPKTQKAVFDELKKRGYNAIVDEANVGTNERGRKGVDPIIVFDSDKSLTNVKSKRVGTWRRNWSGNNYYKWQLAANASAELLKKEW